MISEMIRDVLGSKEKLDWLEREINTKFKKGRGSQTPTVVTAGLLIEILDVLCEIRDSLSPVKKGIVKAEKLTDIVEETEEFVEEETDSEELIEDEDSIIESDNIIEGEEVVKDKKHQLSASTLRRIKQQKKKKK